MKRHAPAADRNKDAILQVLREVLPERGRVVEVASGTGQHAVHFSAALPGIEWQPTDADPGAVQSVEAWRKEAGPENLRPPLRFDVTAGPPPDGLKAADAIVCINMIHISPWAACKGLLDFAAQVLPPGGPLILYGPFFRDEVPTAPSNIAFDQGLRAQDPSWGVRRLEDVRAAASARGLELRQVVELPANNCAVVFRSDHGRS